jgi:23S rRNA pseudouridine2605 synthase
MTDEHRADGPEQDIPSAAPEIVHEEAAAAEPSIPQSQDVPDVIGETAYVPAAPEESDEPDDDRPAPRLERLQKILAQAGIASRRHAEELITGGRVQVNGQIVTVLGTKADPHRDHIRVDGKLLHGAERLRYFLLNKPKGFVTTVSDPEGRPTVMQFFAKAGERLYPVGRLDYMSEGLLLVTNDGELANSLTRAASGVEKTYMVKVAGQPTEDMIERLRTGVAIERGKLGEGKVRTAPARIRQIRPGDNPWFEVVLIEGRNRELRKMFEEIGHHVEKIRRVGYGPLVLDVEPGKFRELATEEVEALRLTAAGKFKPRRIKTNYMLPKEAGKSTEQRMAKETARREKKFGRPMSRDNRRETPTFRPREASAERPTDRRPPARDNARPAFGKTNQRFAPKPATGDRPPRAAGARPERPPQDFRKRPPFRSDRPAFGTKPRFDSRPPRADAKFGSSRPAAGAKPAFGTKPRFDSRPPRADAKFGSSRPAAGAKPAFSDRPPRAAAPRTERPAHDFKKRPPFRSDRPSAAEKPRFDRRPPRDNAAFRSEKPPAKPFRPRSDRPAPDRAPSRVPTDFDRPKTPRPRLEISPVEAHDTAFEREKPKSSRPPRREGSAPSFRGTGAGRPPSKPFRKGPGGPPSGAAKSGFSGRPKPAFGARPSSSSSAPRSSSSRPKAAGFSKPKPGGFKARPGGFSKSKPGGSSKPKFAGKPRTGGSKPRSGGKRPGGKKRG